MKATIITLVTIAVLVLVGGGVYLATRNTSTSTQPAAKQNANSQSHNMNMPMNGSENSTSVTTDNVAIENFAFSPANITIKKGTTVTWVNKDSTPHTVTENDGQTGPDSGMLAKGSSYTFTFNTVGTFKYHCSIHPEMVGTVTVTE